MAIPILMPSLSPTMTEGNLAKWCKKVGDKVKPGDIIAEVETDKATMEIEAIDEGVLETILYNDGDEGIEVNSLIAVLKSKNDSDKDVSEIVLKYKAEDKVIKTPSGSSIEKIGDTNNKDILNDENEQINKKELSNEEKTSNHNFNEDNIEVKNDSITGLVGKKDKDGKRIMISPLAKRMAIQNNIDIDNITGSGPRGRIVKYDIDNLINKNSSLNNFIHKENKIKNISSMRKVIAERLSFSKSNIPHFYLSINCNVDNLLLARNDMNLDREEIDNISINDIIIKALALALEKVPEANSSWSDNKITYFGSVNISVAVAVKEGLFTPVIKSAETIQISEISRLMKDFVKRAHEGKLLPEEYEGGNFSISNLGMYDIDNFSAIINPPQSGILAVGAIKKMPIVYDDEIKISNVLSCQLSGDHRVIDGAVGANLLKVFKNIIENPYKMLV